MHAKQTISLKEICFEKPKLRTFVQFKDFGPVPHYICKPMSFICPKFLAITRLSTLCIRVETRHFERPKLELNQRFCPNCQDGAAIEDEYNLIFQCEVYKDFMTLEPP